MQCVIGIRRIVTLQSTNTIPLVIYQHESALYIASGLCSKCGSIPLFNSFACVGSHNEG